MITRKCDNCNSSSILKWEYSDNKTLQITFASRKGDSAIYNYYGVEESVIDGLENAESVGKYFIANIKNVYTIDNKKCERVLYYNE